MIIVSKIYPIGTGCGQWPAGDKLTDSLIGFAPVASITLGSQNYNQNLVLTGDCLDWSASQCPSTQDGDFLTVNFAYAIKINE